MKYGIVVALLSVFALGACKTKEAPPAPAPIESPVRQITPVTETIVTSKPIMVKEKKKTKQKSAATPRLDALEKRVLAIETKINAYEKQYGQ